MKTPTLFALFFGLLALPALAATVEFKDGRRYEFRLLGENRSAYLMLIDGMQVQIPKSMVVSISAQGAEPQAKAEPTPPNRPVVRGEGAAPVPVQEPQPIPTSREEKPLEIDQGATAPPVILMPLPADQNELLRLQHLVDSLSMENTATDRSQARTRLADAGDASLAVLATYGLYHETPSVRTASAELLGNFGGRRVLKVLIEAFYSAAEATIPPYQRAYVGTLMEHLNRLTGQNWRLYARRTATGPQIAQEVVDWWQQNFDRVPTQLGEPILDPTRADYYSALRGLRALTLERRYFAGSNLPLNIAAPPQPNTPAEVLYMEQFAVVPPGIGVAPELPISHQPIVPKTPSPARDYPGFLREQQLAERLRAEEAARSGLTP